MLKRLQQMKDKRRQVIVGYTVLGKKPPPRKEPIPETATMAATPKSNSKITAKGEELKITPRH